MTTVGKAQWTSGSEEVYAKLRELAAGYLRGERRGHTLQPTALVNEGFLRLLSSGGIGGVGGSALVRAAARAMRHVLVDHARRHHAAKRGGDLERNGGRIPLDDALSLYEQSSIDLLALDEALDRLGRMDPELQTIVELRYFGGLTEEQTARQLGVSTRTVTRGWRFARHWLASQLGEGSPT